MFQSVLSPALVSTSATPVCIDPFQINVSECSFMPINDVLFGYDAERDECRQVKDLLLCDQSQHALFKNVDDCQKCIEHPDGISQITPKPITCFDKPCESLCVTNLYTINCFVPPCPQYKCIPIKK